MPKRVGQAQRKTPLLFPKTVTPMAAIGEQILAIADPPQRSGNITTGPEHTPLRPATPKQIEAHMRQRLERVLRKDSTWDNFFLSDPQVSDDFEK